MTTHMPDDAYGIVRRLVGPVGPELSCDECFDLLDVYVELEERGGDADAAMPAMRAHLLGCPACRDDHDSLRALIDLAAVGCAYFLACHLARQRARCRSRPRSFATRRLRYVRMPGQTTSNHCQHLDLAVSG